MILLFAFLLPLGTMNICRPQAVSVARTVIPASGSLASVDGRAFLVGRTRENPLRVAAVTIERWSLVAHALKS